VRVQFRQEGGLAHFPGLSRPVALDGTVLSRDEADELQCLVAAARFFERPARAAAPPRGAADYRRYTITVDDGGRQHTVTVTDPVEDPALQRLLAFLQAKARALRRAE
jgi:hypothetical protein